MTEFFTVLTAVLPVFVIMIAGVVMRKVNWLTEEADHSMLRVTVNLLAPALILDSILNNDALKQPENVLIPPLVGFGTVAMGIGVGYLLGKFAAMSDQKVLRTLALCVGIYNYGYIPVPLVNSLFDRETLGVLFVHNVGVEICFWTLGVGILGASDGKGWRKFFSPPVIAILVALPMNYLVPHEAIPQWLMMTARMLGMCAVPMGIILVGAMIADHLHEFHSAHGWKTIILSCIGKLVIVPVLFLLLARFIPASDELKRVIIVEGAMPTATFTVILARRYGGDPSTAVRGLIATSALGLITIPLWIRTGLKFVGL